MKRCIGFGDLDGNCEARPDLKLNPAGLWCTRCEYARRAKITASLAEVQIWFAEARQATAEATTTKPGGVAAPNQEA